MRDLKEYETKKRICRQQNSEPRRPEYEGWTNWMDALAVSLTEVDGDQIIEASSFEHNSWKYSY